MNRITEAERKRFHKIVDDSIDKLNSPKNSTKIHWSKMSIPKLQKSINVENAELECSMVDYPYYLGGIENEIFDIINYSLFMSDNLRSNR